MIPVKDLPERKAELNALESAFQDRLRDLGQDWDESRLQTFDTSMAFRQEVETGKDALAQRQTPYAGWSSGWSRNSVPLLAVKSPPAKPRNRLPANPAAAGRRRAVAPTRHPTRRPPAPQRI